MKKIFVVAGATAFLVLQPGIAGAYNCNIGGEQVSVSAMMTLHTDSTGRAVQLHASTTRSVEDSNQCAGWVRVEGWIDGDPGGAMSHQQDTIARLGGDYVGPFMMIGSSAATYYGHSKHWFIHDGWLGDPWSHIVDMDTSIGVAAVDGTDPNDPECPDPVSWHGGKRPRILRADFRFVDEGPYPCNESPIIVDVSGDGYLLTGPEQGVSFDVNGDGIREKVSWTAADSDDAFLAMDRNGNGLIDDGSELFGNNTPAYAGSRKPTAANGFEALKFLESPGYGTSTAGGVIDGNDAVFSRLVLWTDRNHNGFSESDELLPLASAAVVALETQYKESRRKDAWGNEFRQRAKIWFQQPGAAAPTSRFMFDVWLQRLRIGTRPSVRAA